MPLHDNKPIVVAIDKDKHSTLAVRWAIENLLVSDRTLILIHVRTRRRLVQEVVLEGTDVHTALLDYINNNYVTNIVLGASSRNALSRPHSLKGGRKTADLHHHHEILNRWFKNSSGDNNSTFSNRAPRNSASHDFLDNDLMEPGFSLSSMDITQVEISDTPNYVAESDDLEGSSLSSVDELQQLKMDELSRVEQARLAQEAALLLVEMEKEKCRAAIEAAEKAQKIAEKETRRRKHAEMKAKREAEEKNRALDVLSNKDVRYRKYTIEEIQAATNNFSSSMKIGEGGYGPVFKGKLDHTPVAIKLLRPDAAQGRKQFQQEVEVLSCIRHPNMVLLMGACPEYGCLVYEFMDNGSLEDRLFRKGNTPPIPWGIRFKLAADIATGLLFLHQSKPEPLVHRDIKPANILLDHHYTCKISDVGLARLVPPSIADIVTQYHMTSAAGTFCYIDPEPPMGLTHHVERAIEKGTFGDLLDPTVSNWPIDEALGFARLGLKCLEMRKRDRLILVKRYCELERLKELGMKDGLGHWHASRRSNP
ncbi:hypothetical protein DH2020_001846 [Rehmannia glutinosa]|uniref:RING-type E3 ubiquitin transferase n=1 Tax=Rehmannia glutinosa TaxID=99300 RepID=A0ABR0XSJ3_REHGL